MGLSSADIYETYNDDPRQMTVIGDLGDNVNEPGGLPAKNPEELVQAVPVVLGDSHRFYLTRDVYLTVEDERFVLKNGEQIVRPKTYIDIVAAMNKERKSGYRILWMGCQNWERITEFLLTTGMQR